jgi:hypothetical protein
MKIYLKRDGDNLVPLSVADHDAIKRIKDGQIIHVDFKKPRNPLFHNKFMSMIRVVFDNQEQHGDIENILAIVKVELGYYTTMMYGKYEIRVPKSISFAAMDELKFDHFYNRAIAVCLTNWLPGTTKKELDEYVAQISSYAT